MTTTALTVKNKTIMEAIEARKTTYVEMLPKGVNVDRFMRSAILVVMRTPKLGECDPASFVTVVTNAAELGLDFTQAKGHAYIVPFGKVATFMPGYRGLIELARRSGDVQDIDAHIVYKNEYESERFQIAYGMKPILVHLPIIVGDRGEPIGAYAIARMTDGVMKPLFMNMEELAKVKRSSKASANGPWVDWPEEMMKKTVIRRLCKMLPLSPDMEKAIEFDNEVAGIADAGATPGEGRTNKLADIIGGGPTDDAEFEDVPDSETTEGDLFDKPGDEGGKPRNSQGGE